MAVVLPPDWERYPELAQALQVLVEGAARALRGASERPRADSDPDQKQAGALP